MWATSEAVATQNGGDFLPLWDPVEEIFFHLSNKNGDQTKGV
jgi:hypothetical protein